MAISMIRKNILLVALVSAFVILSVAKAASEAGSAILTVTDSSITLYGDTFYGGGSKQFTSDIPSLTGSGFNPNAASSAKVSSGTTGVLYAGDSYQGAYIVLTSDTPDFTSSNVCFNDETNSVRVIPASSAPPLQCTGANPCEIAIPAGSGTAWGESAVINTGDRYWRFTLSDQYEVRAVSMFRCDGRLKLGTSAGGGDICNVNSGGSGSFEACIKTLAAGTYYITNSCDSGCGITSARAEYKDLNACSPTPPSGSITLENGCSVTVNANARDETDVNKDGGAGRWRNTVYSDSSNVPGYKEMTTEFDDAPSGGCDMDLKIGYSWGKGISDPNKGWFTVTVNKLAKDASHQLSYGHKLQTSGTCKFLKLNSICGSVCPIGIGTQMVSVLQPDSFNFVTHDFRVGECLSDSDCNFDAAKPKCNTVTNMCESKCTKNDLAGGKSSQCSSDKPYCDVGSGKCGECLTDNNCVSAGKTCDAQGFPNRHAKCDLVTKICSVCGGCVFNADCSLNYCCEATSSGGPGGNQCIKAGVHPATQSYLCKTG